MYHGITVEHSYNCMVLLCRLFLGLSGHYTKIDSGLSQKANIYRGQYDMGGKYDSNTISLKWGVDNYGNRFIYILVDGAAVCALSGWTRFD